MALLAGTRRGRVVLAVVVVAVLAAGVVLARRTRTGSDLVEAVPIDVAAVAAPDPRPGPRASTGTWETRCGRNEEGRHNTDNLVVSPGQPGAAHHVHDYVGNTSTTAFSTDATLAAAPTTCADGRDRSTYYWPVLRALDGDDGDGHDDGNTGRKLTPVEVRLVYRGNPLSPVVAPPRFLRLSVGDARGASAERVWWTCSGVPDRRADRYPACPAGQRVVRRFDFPSCWNGLGTDSPDHRSHLAFASPTGVCPRGTFPIPQLRAEVAYDVPGGVDIAIDTFPDVGRSPRADHAHAIDVMGDDLGAEVVDCLNRGRTC